MPGRPLPADRNPHGARRRWGPVRFFATALLLALATSASAAPVWLGANGVYEGAVRQDESVTPPTPWAYDGCRDDAPTNLTATLRVTGGAATDRVLLRIVGWYGNYEAVATAARPATITNARINECSGAAQVEGDWVKVLATWRLEESWS